MANATQIAKMEAGAREYALADKSDPFAFNRAMSHVRNGIADIRGDVESFYVADPFQELRHLPNGEGYHIIAYRNAKRP